MTTHKIPGTALVPVFSHQGGGVPGTAPFGYGRIQSALAFETALGVIPDAQTWRFQGPCTPPTMTTHASERWTERVGAPLPVDGWHLWSAVPTWSADAVGALGARGGFRDSRWLATVEITAHDSSTVLVVCPVQDGQATTAYCAEPYEGRRLWDLRRERERWRLWAQGRLSASCLAPPTPEQTLAITTWESTRIVAALGAR